MASASAIFASWRLWSAAGCRRPPEWGDPPRTDGRLDLDRWEPLVAWVVLLGDVTDGELDLARIEIARTVAPWWPTIPQVLDAVRRRPAALDAREVWGRVKPRLSSYSEPEDALRDAFDAADLPAVLSAIDSVGGWRALCASPVTEEPHTQRRIAEAYTIAAGRAAYAVETETSGRLLELRRRTLAGPVEGERPGLAEWVRGGGAT